MKFKALKLWQMILLIFSVILLGIGGSFLYVHLTTGIGPRSIYPEDIYFVVDKTNEGYNSDLEQYEKSSNFKIAINSNTDSVTKKEITLSFTVNFTEQANEEGYITDGIITIPQKVILGEEFEVIVNQGDITVYDFLAEGETLNIGGVSNIYAKTENKLLSSKNIKVAIDVPVYKTEIEFYDSITNTKINPISEETFNITKGADIRLVTKFYPEKSEYLYSDAMENPRKKKVFLEITEGVDNLTKIEGENVYSVTGEISSSVSLKSYVFKNAADQVRFYAEHSLETGEQLHNSAIQYLSSSEGVSVTSKCNMTIVEANVDSFTITQQDKIEFITNKLYKVSASRSDYADMSFGVSILDNIKNPLTPMIKNLAMRILKKSGEEWNPANDIQVVGGESVVVDGAEYIFINSNVNGLNNAYWEISSRDVGANYKVELVLLLRDLEAEKESEEKVYKKFKNSYLIDLEFKESVETSISWIDNSDIEMVVFAGVGTASEYEKNLQELIFIPENNNYKKVVFFAEFAGMSENEIKEYVDIVSYKEYSIGEETKYLAEINGSRLFVKKGVSFTIRFAVVKTDAYGNILLSGDGAYQISQMSNSLNVKAIETVTGLGQDTIKLNIDDKYIYEDQLMGNYYVIPVGEGEFNLVVTLDEDNSKLFLAQINKMKVVAYDNDLRQEIDALEITQPATAIQNGADFKLTYALKFKTSICANGDKHILIKFVYDNGVTISSYDILGNVANNQIGYLTAYDSKPEKIELGDIANSYEIEHELSVEGNYTEPKLKAINSDATISEGDFNTSLTGIIVYDKYNRDITANNTISIVSNNSAVVKVETIDNKKGISIVKGASGSATLTISCGNASATVAFIANAEQISKITWIIDEINDAEIAENGSNSAYSITNLSSVDVAKLGYKENVITLAKLVKIGIGQEEKTLNPNAYQFKLQSLIGMDNDTKGYLFATDGMIKVNEDGSIPAAETAITTLTINHDFGQDVLLVFNIVGTNSGINITLNLTIRSNVASVTKNFSSINYGEDKDAPAGDNDYVGVYAQHPIELNNVVVVSKKKNENLNWEEKTVDENDNLQLTITGGILTFKEVYEVTDVSYTLYEVEGNPYAFNTILKCKVYPNIQIEIPDHVLDYTKIANGNTVGLENNYFVVSRYTNSETTVPKLSYSLTSNAVVPVTITLDSLSQKPVFQKSGSLTLEYGEIGKSFSVEIKNEDNAVIKDYAGNTAVIDMTLSLGISYEQFASSIGGGVCVYDGKEYILVEYKTEPITLDQTKLNTDYTYVVGNRDGLINIFAADKFIIIQPAKGITYGEESYLPLSIYNGATSVAFVKLPLFITTVGQGFAHYNNYNQETEGFDLNVLLANDPQILDEKGIFAEFTAGSDYQIVYNSSLTNTSLTINDTNTELKIEEIADTLKLSYLKDGITYYGYISKSNTTFSDTSVVGGTVKLKGNESITLSKLYLYSEGIYYNPESANINVEVIEGGDVASIDGDKLKLRHLAKEDKFVILQVTLTSKYNGVFTYYYRIKVKQTVTVNINYPYAGDLEYLTIDNSDKYSIDLSSKFSITPLSIDKTSTNVVKEIVIDGVTYIVGGDKPIAVDGKTYSVANKIAITFRGVNDDEMDIVLYDLNTTIYFVVTKNYTNVANSDLDYKFCVNMTNFKYMVEVAGGSYNAGENSYSLAVNPESQEIIIKTRQTNKDYSNIITDVNTSLVETTVKFEYDGNTSDGNTITIDNITLTYDYANKKLSITKNGSIDKNYEIALIFSVIVRNNKGETIETQSNIGRLNLTIQSEVIIEESATEVSGGGTYIASDFISKVQKFKKNTDNKYEYQDESSATLKITDVSYPDNDTPNEVKPFINLADDGKITVAMLTENQSAYITITVKIGDNTYKFKLYKTFNRSVTYVNNEVLKEDEPSAYTYIYEGTYYAGETAGIDFGDFLNIKNSTNGTITVASYPTSVNGVSITSVEIAEINLLIYPPQPTQYTLIIKTENVAKDTPIVLPVTFTYSFPVTADTTYTYNFVVKISMTVKQNVASKVNYPDPTGNSELQYETIGTEGVTTLSTESTTTYRASLEDIREFFVSKKHELAKGNRVVFNNVDGGSEVTFGNLTDVTVTLISAENVKVFNNETDVLIGATIQGDNDITIALNAGVSVGDLVFAIKYSGVSQEYNLHVVTGNAYTINTNATISSKNSVETIYPDGMSDTSIFQNDRIIQLTIPSDINTSYNNKVIDVNLKEDDEASTTYTVSFLMKVEQYRGKTIYIEAGKSLNGFTIESIKCGDTEIEKDYLQPKLTERITVTYATKEGPVFVNKTYITGVVNSDKTVSATDSEQTVTNGQFSSYTLQGTSTGTEYVVSYNIYIKTSSTVQVSGTFKYKLDLDIEVENNINNQHSYIIIEASDFTSVRNLVSLAGIRHPSTGQYIKAKDFTNNVSSKLEIVTSMDSVVEGFRDGNKSLSDIDKEAIDATYTNIGTVKFLTYTEVKGTDSDDKVYDYIIIGEGAANSGSWVMLKYTYNSGNLNKDFYIMVKILPDYRVTVDGRNITSVNSDDVSVSSNINNIYQVDVSKNASGETQDPAYSLLVTSPTKSDNSKPIINITKENIASPDEAYKWTYSMTENDSHENSNLTFNTDLTSLKTKVNGGNEADLTLNKDNIWECKPGSTLEISKDKENVFGTKYYKMKIVNIYGYEVYFFFKFVPKNSQDPTVASSTNMIDVTEGDTFDIGALYEKVTLTNENGKYLLSVTSEAPAKKDENGTISYNVVDIAGIDAWGFDTTATNISPSIINPSGTKYEDESKMLLQYITVDKIEFKYNNINVGNIIGSGNAPLGKKLATDKNLKYSGVIENSTSSFTHVEVIDGNYTMPELEPWIYNQAASLTPGANYPETDTVPVTMIIWLKYQKSGTDAETYQVQHTINVSRKVTVTRARPASTTGITLVESTVADGEDFYLVGKDFGLVNYFEVKKGDVSGATFLDDTLIVTLPKNDGATIQKLTINAEVKSGGKTVAKMTDYKIENSIGRAKTFYISISKNLKHVDTQGKEYILKSGDTITFTFSDYGNNNTLDDKGTQDDKVTQQFYAMYSGQNLLLPSDKVTLNTNTEGEITGSINVSSITQDKINIEDAILTYSGCATVIKSYVISVGGENYRVEKEYFVTPRYYKPNLNMDPAINPLTEVNYSTATGSDGQEQYTIDFNTWSADLQYYKGTGATNPPSQGSDVSGTLDMRYIRIEIGKTGDTPGTAIVDENGNILTRTGYPLDKQEYIQVNIYVKASGFDGVYGQSNAYYDYLLGSLRLLVVSNKETTKTKLVDDIEYTVVAIDGDLVTIQHTEGNNIYVAIVNKDNLSGTIKTDETVTINKKEDGNAVISVYKYKPYTPPTTQQ